jgi:hypothetical protein
MGVGGAKFCGRKAPAAGLVADLVAAGFGYCTSRGVSTAALFEAVARAWRDDLLQQARAAPNNRQEALRCVEQARIIGLTTARLNYYDGPTYLRHLCCCLLTCPAGAGEEDAAAAAALTITNIGMSVLGQAASDAPVVVGIKVALALRLGDEAREVAASWKATADNAEDAAVSQLQSWRAALLASPTLAVAATHELRLALRIAATALGFVHAYAALLDDGECWYRVNDVLKAGVDSDTAEPIAEAAVDLIGYVYMLSKTDPSCDSQEEAREAAAFLHTELSNLAALRGDGTQRVSRAAANALL